MDLPASAVMAVLGALGPCVFDGRTGLPVSPDEAWRRVLAAQVVHLGERHDDPAHHRAQASVISALAAAGRRPAAALEMLYAGHQQALDRYLSGASDEASFLAEVDWGKTWGFPFALYRPVFAALQANGLPGIAANVPMAVIRKIRSGGLASLTPEERAQLPDEVPPPEDPAYLEMLRQSYLAHGYPPDDESAFARFIASQSAWNEGMAWRVVQYLDRNPGASVIVVAGGLHAYDAAIPAGVARRLPGVRQATVILSSAPECPARLDPADLALSADLVWVVRP